ncbi:hypothetical protein DLAC_00227 [Tieghemostelium lacteum]|uniref:phosphoglycerate mutase (2,3-diphosphoglycerate-dependent) n=1 Tax=Tieghemostelium lacteum TaxID=361077 RepID=A0A152A973_TIELA|nr:hypothetical protein DLAC_00227 [Tieghemostelium lacteum]|eukprot:KYR02764.1 hypothetical protein DLAC_00227 [Tieghemostelium lacteum]
MIESELDNDKIKFVILITTIGSIIIELFDKTPKTNSKFIELCKSNRYQDTIVHRIVKNFFVQLGRYSVLDKVPTTPSASTTPTPLKSYSTVVYQTSSPQLSSLGSQDDDSLVIKDNKLDIDQNIDDLDDILKETLESKLKFSSRGLVCLGNYNQILITLDACDGLNRKYPIFGRIHSTSLQLLDQLDATTTDINNSPLTPIVLVDIQYQETLVTQDSDTSSLKSTPTVSGVNGNNKRPLEEAQFQLQSPILLKKMKTQLLNITTPVNNSIATSLSTVHKLDSTPLLGKLQHQDSQMTRTISVPNMQVPNTYFIKPKWPVRLVVVRHAQSEQNAALDLFQDDIDRLAGVRDADIKLTQVGEWQATKTGEYLATTTKFDVCFTSPYFRAVETSKLIINQLGYQIKLHKDNWLREKEFGRLHGLTEQMIKERYPDEHTIRNRDGRYWFRPIGGENYADVELRIHAFLEKISRNYSGKSVLIITHQVPYKIFNSLFHHLDEEGLLGLEPVYNCGVQEYILDTSKSPEGRLKLKHFNYKSFNMAEVPPNLSGNRKSRDQK